MHLIWYMFCILHLHIFLLYYLHKYFGMKLPNPVLSVCPVCLFLIITLVAIQPSRLVA